MDVDLEELAAIVELLDKADFTEFRFDKGDLHILVRRGDLPADAAAEPAPGPVSAARPEPAAQPAPQAAPMQVPADEDGTELVRAPMLGTFYRSPKPGEPPFVQVGDKVDADAVVCIVEVMKLMNSVRAGISGQVTKIFAADGQLVEFDQPLFAVKVTP